MHPRRHAHAGVVARARIDSCCSRARDDRGPSADPGHASARRLAARARRPRGARTSPTRSASTRATSTTRPRGSGWTSAPGSTEDPTVPAGPTKTIFDDTAGPRRDAARRLAEDVVADYLEVDAALNAGDENDPPSPPRREERDEPTRRRPLARVDNGAVAAVAIRRRASPPPSSDPPRGVHPGGSRSKDGTPLPPTPATSATGSSATGPGGTCAWSSTWTRRWCARTITK